VPFGTIKINQGNQSGPLVDRTISDVMTDPLSALFPRTFAQSAGVART